MSRRYLTISFAILAVLTGIAYAAPVAYITNVGSSTVSVINTGTNTVVATIPVGDSPFGVTVNPAGTRAYVANQGDSTVSVIDMSSNGVIATVPVGASPFAVAVNPGGTRFYVVNSGEDTVSVMDAGTNHLIGKITVGGGPQGIAVNPNGSRAYVANQGDSTVSVIDILADTVVATVPAGTGTFGVAVNPSGTRAYVTNQEGTVSVIDTSSNSVVATITVGSSPFGIDVGPDGTRAYVANEGDGTVSVISTAANAVVATVGVGSGPYGLAVDPAGTHVYVANLFSNSVSVIGTGSNSVIATVPVGSSPAAFGRFIGGNGSTTTGPVRITNGPPPNGTVGTAYTFNYTFTGMPTFSVTSGSLPPGLALSASGAITGTPTTAGTFTGIVTATDGTESDMQSFSTMIAPAIPHPPAITNGPPPNGTVGVAYSFAYTSTGAPTFSVMSGTLPPGLTLSADGVISGTPTTIGTSTGVVVASNGVAPNANQNFTIKIVAPTPPPPPTITNGPPPGGTVGISYTFTYTSTGAPTFTVKTGSLPPGLALSPAGVISGSPTITGSFTGTITASNGTAPDANQNFSITIQPPTHPTITNGPPPDGTVGIAYTFTYTSTGAPVFSIKSGTLPPGLTLSAGGVISGTPTTAATFSGVVNASNGTAPDANQSFSITIFTPRPPTITNGPPPNGTVGFAYSFSYTSIGAPAFSIKSGGLPPGLTLSSEGVISGSPTTAGFFSGVVLASNGTAPDATQNFSISIVTPTPPSITNGPPPDGTLGLVYNFTYTSIGSPTFTVTSGSLPAGLTLSSTGTISGTPTAVGISTGTVTASNGITPDATQSFSITIVAPSPPTITNGPPPGGVVGVSYAFPYTSTGSPTFSVTSGTLPPGLTLSPAGVISGDPTTAGTFTGVVTASNGTAPSFPQPFSITIVMPAPSPTIENGPPPSLGTLGVAYTFSFTSTGSPTFSITSGSLPPGLTLSASGVVSGTPAATGTFSATVTATNGISPDATQDFSITIIPPGPRHRGVRPSG